MPACLWVVAVLAAVVLLPGCRGPAGVTGPQGDPGLTLDWSDTIADGNLATATYAIGVHVLDPPESDASIFVGVGSGFSAHYRDVIWTNAHVVETVRNVLDLVHDRFPDAGAVATVVRSGTAVGGAGTYRVDLSESFIHPDYDAEDKPFESPDIALLRIDAELADVPSFLPRGMATHLRTGQPIGTLGFPEELSNPLEVVPVATFKDGVISALRPYSPEETSVTPENSRIVQHNLDTTGGTSGSAIFDHAGFIVAVNFAGTVTAVLGPGESEGEVEVVAVPTGNIGLAIRVDEVWTMIDAADAGASPPAAAAREYPYRAYRAFPEIP